MGFTPGVLEWSLGLVPEQVPERAPESGFPEWVGSKIGSSRFRFLSRFRSALWNGCGGMFPSELRASGKGSCASRICLGAGASIRADRHAGLAIEGQDPKDQDTVQRDVSCDWKRLQRGRHAAALKPQKAQDLPLMLLCCLCHSP